MIRRAVAVFVALIRHGHRAGSLAAQAEQNAQNVRRLVGRSRALDDVVGHLEAGRLSLVDLRFGIFTPADRMAEHNDALKWRAMHDEGAGRTFTAI